MEVFTFIFSHRSAPVRVLLYDNKLFRAEAVSIFLNSFLVCLSFNSFGVLNDLCPEVSGVFGFVFRYCVHIMRLLVPLLYFLSLFSLLGSCSCLFVIIFISYVRSWVSISVPPLGRFSFLLILILILDVLAIFIPMSVFLFLTLSIRVSVLIFTILLLVLKVRIFLDLIVGALMLVLTGLIVVVHVVVFLVLLLMLRVLVHLLLHVLLLHMLAASRFLLV